MLSVSMDKFWKEGVVRVKEEVNKYVLVFRVAMPNVPSKMVVRLGEEPYSRIVFRYALAKPT